MINLKRNMLLVFCSIGAVFASTQRVFRTLDGTEKTVELAWHDQLVRDMLVKIQEQHGLSSNGSLLQGYRVLAPQELLDRNPDVIYDFVMDYLSMFKALLITTAEKFDIPTGKEEFINDINAIDSSTFKLELIDPSSLILQEKYDLGGRIFKNKYDPTGKHIIENTYDKIFHLFLQQQANSSGRFYHELKGEDYEALVTILGGLGFTVEEHEPTAQDPGLPITFRV